MEIGLEGPEDVAALRQVVSTAHLVEELLDQMPDDVTELSPEGSDLAALIAGLPDPLVDLRLTIAQGLVSAAGCLSQIVAFVEGSIPTTAPVLQTLARTALLSATRVVFVLGSDDASERERNAKIVLRQEANSLMRLYKAAETFTALQVLVPPPDVLTAQRARAELVNQSAAPWSETQTLQETAALVGRLLQAGGYDVDDAHQREHVTWTFNVYSGVAHGFAWPRYVPGTSSMPGHFIVEMTMIANVVHLAVDLTLRRSDRRPAG